MSHKLVIEFTATVKSELGAHVLPGDVIRGEVFDLTLRARNIGDSAFPGGEIVALTVDYRPYGTSQNSWQATVSELRCPPIPRGDERTVHTEEMFAVDEGSAWIHLSIRAADGDAIEYYQAPESKLEDSGEWISPIYVVKREDIRIIALLEKIAALLS